jgi:hypothetical protein
MIIEEVAGFCLLLVLVMIAVARAPPPEPKDRSLGSMIRQNRDWKFKKITGDILQARQKRLREKRGAALEPTASKSVEKSKEPYKIIEVKRSTYHVQEVRREQAKCLPDSNRQGSKLDRERDSPLEAAVDWSSPDELRFGKAV